MSELMDRAKALRDDPSVHYNCAQAVFIPFAERKGIGAEMASAITANFGAGMRTGGTCGAITGALMALGLYGAGGPKDSGELFRRMQDLHGGRSDCHTLLAEEVQCPADKKPHCDNMVYEAVAAVEEMLSARGIVY